MNIREFREFTVKYNVSARLLAELAHTDTYTVKKYALGEKIGEGPQKKLDNVIRIIDGYELVRPVWNPDPRDDIEIYSAWYKDKREQYKKMVTRLISANE